MKRKETVARPVKKKKVTVERPANTYWHYTEDSIHHESAEAKSLLARHEARQVLSAEPNAVLISTSGDITEQVEVLHSQMGIGPPPENIRYDFKAIRPAEVIRPFSGSSRHQQQVAADHFLNLNCPEYLVCCVANDKAWLQKECGPDPKCLMPQGYVCESRDDVKQAVATFHNAGKNARIKVTESAGGYGQSIVCIGEKIELPAALAEKDKKQVFLVQEDVVADIDASVQFFVTKDGKLTITALVGQHIEGRKRHFGNFYPVRLFAGRLIPRGMDRAMKNAAAAIVGRLVHKLKYFGYGSVDFVCNTETQQVWALEVNCRVTATFYPIMASRRWWNKTIWPFDMRSFPVPAAMSFTDLLRHFQGLTLDKKTTKGFVPFCHIPEHGFCYGVAFAPTPEQLRRLITRVDERKNALIPS